MNSLLGLRKEPTKKSVMVVSGTVIPRSPEPETPDPESLNPQESKPNPAPGWTSIAAQRPVPE